MQTPASTIISTGDLGGHKIKMQIDASAMAHIMSILTDLYSDPEAAVIREYSTNALDSHIQAGNEAPIQIFTPNAMSPYFIVKDFGVGLSESDIEEMYSKYGASTKRETNDQVGMLGLGAKSALTLVPTFNLISVKDGVRITVAISRAADGSGQMEVIARTATTEPNGVEIKIPVPRNSTFIGKVRDFFRFWKEGTVLVDGKAPETVGGRPVGDKFLVNKNLHKDYIVMGNVAYPCKTSLYEHSSDYSQVGIVAFVNIGDVNFTPSREELHYTPQTKATIQRIRREFGVELQKSANADVAAAASYAEAWKRAREWRSSFYGRLGEFKYNGIQVPTDIPFAKDGSDPTDPYPSNIQGKQFNVQGRNGRYATWVRSTNPTMIDDHIFVTGFAESLKLSPVQRERVQIYVDNQGWNCTQVIVFKQDEFITDSAHLKFLEGIKIVPWEDIAKIKIQRAKGVGKVRVEKYDVFNGNWRYVPASDFDTTLPIIYISPTEDKQPLFLRTIFPDAQIVMLGRNRWDKFKRDWPTAQHYLVAIDKERAELIAQFTEEDKVLWNFDSYSRRPFEVFEADRVDDPDLKRFVKIIKGGIKLSTPAATLRTWPRGYNTADVELPENPLTKYPLSYNISSTSSDHAHWYVNSYYAYLNSKEN